MNERFLSRLAAEVRELEANGAAKGMERCIGSLLPATEKAGPRYRLAGFGGRRFLRMNSNGYLGLSRHPAVIAAAERAVRRYGMGPEAVRFISGTFAPHAALESRLAAFHDRPAAVAFNAAYTTMLGVLPSLAHDRTLILSDALNHNCIINAIRLARAGRAGVVPHGDAAALAARLRAAGRRRAGRPERVLVVTDGVFSMRGNHAPLDTIREIIDGFEPVFSEGVSLIVDDSHGIGAYGPTGRGTEEVCETRADVLVGTLGKAFGVNGGYVVGEAPLIRYLREKAPPYIYSNPIGPGEAAAAEAAVRLVSGAWGRKRVRRVNELAARLRARLGDLGWETVPAEHPIVALLVRDPGRMRRLVGRLFEGGILATGLRYPVVPHGDETIRFQVSAEHSPQDIDRVAEVLGGSRTARGRGGRSGTDRATG